MRNEGVCNSYGIMKGMKVVCLKRKIGFSVEFDWHE